MAHKLQWGILSTAKIGTKKVIPAMQRGALTEVVAIASRTAAVAKAAASRLEIPRAYGSYDELLADPDIQAVYNPLPNHMHVPWTLRALQAGKHVLCEKPVALNAAEAEQLLEEVRTRPGLKVMEAFMYRFHPQWRTAKELVDSGAIGEPRSVRSSFSYHNVERDNIRNIREIGGGALFDIGCYGISVPRFLLDSEPRRVCGSMQYDPDFHTDRLTSGILEFDGRTAAFTCATQLSPHQRVEIFGTTGRLEVELPFTPTPGHACRLRLHLPSGVEEIVLEPADQYTIQGDLFSRAVLEDTDVPTPLEDALANMRVIDAVAESARTRAWVELEDEPRSVSQLATG